MLHHQAGRAETAVVVARSQDQAEVRTVRNQGAAEKQFPSKRIRDPPFRVREDQRIDWKAGDRPLK